MSRPKRILIVDDDATNRKLLKNHLDLLGYESEFATDGYEALEKARQGVDLVLLDVMMPGMDGFEAATHIRADPQINDLPICMVTILTGKEDRLRAVEAGANDFISKPIDRLELQIRVASLLKIKESQDAIKRHRADLEIMVEKRTAALLESETRFRRLYEESKRREELYHSFLSSSADAIVIYDTQGITKYVSPSFTSMFGWTLEDLNGRPVPYVPESERVASAAKIARLMRTGEPCTAMETRRVTKDGEIRDISLSAARYHDHHGEPAGMVVILRDVTEKKRMSEALQEAEKRFQTLFESAQDLVFIKGPDLKYMDVNPAMVEILEKAPSEIVGVTDRELFGEEYAAATEDVEKRVLQGQTVETQQTGTFRGQRIIFDITRFPLRDSVGAVSGVCGIARDVTGRADAFHGAPDSEDEFPSSAMRATLKSAGLAAGSDSIVLLTGESGSGKDHMARHIHDHSGRSHGAFYAVNCAAIPADLAESELFGHEAGAFTGASRRKRGLVELAEGGTLLLNEVGELSPPLQAKLLTFLDTFAFTRVGGEKPVAVNVRLVAATNRELEKDVTAERFRRDLYYRLNVFSIRVPALRERIEDIPVLVSRILSRLMKDMQLPLLPRVREAAMDRLRKYTWPGNVRELRNVLERALILSHGEPIEPSHLRLGDGEETATLSAKIIPQGASLYEALGAMERSMIEEALAQAHGKRHEAARILGISRFALTRHMTKLGILER